MEMFGKRAAESVCVVIMLASFNCSKSTCLRLDILTHVVKTSLVGILVRMRSHCILRSAMERLSCVVVLYEACPRFKVVGQFSRPGRFGVPPRMSPPVLGAMVLPASTGKRQKNNSENCNIHSQLLKEKKTV